MSTTCTESFPAGFRSIPNTHTWRRPPRGRERTPRLGWLLEVIKPSDLGLPIRLDVFAGRNGNSVEPARHFATVADAETWLAHEGYTENVPAT